MTISCRIPKVTVLRRYMSDFPRLINKLEYRLAIGKKAPQMANSCKIRALSIHLSVIAIVINSGATNDNPNIQGKEIKAVNRSILRKALTCRSESSVIWAKIGCATLPTIPEINEKPM